MLSVICIKVLDKLLPVSLSLTGKTLILFSSCLKLTTLFFPATKASYISIPLIFFQSFIFLPFFDVFNDYKFIPKLQDIKIKKMALCDKLHKRPLYFNFFILLELELPRMQPRQYYHFLVLPGTNHS